MVSLRGWLPDVRNPLNIPPSAKPPVGQSSTGGAFCLSKTLWASTTFKSGALAKQRPKTWNMEQYWTVAVLMKWKAGAVYEERDSYQPTLVWSVLSFPGQSVKFVNFQKTLNLLTERSQVPLKKFKSELGLLWLVTGNEHPPPLRCLFWGVPLTFLSEDWGFFYFDSNWFKEIRKGNILRDEILTSVQNTCF